MTATLDTAAPYAPPDGIQPFLRTIAERPDDMGPRLVFADYLEERGDPWGEFVRVGVEMANHPQEKIGWSFLADGTSSDAESRAVNDENPVRERLQRRHRELLARHGAAWARTVLKGVWPGDFHSCESKQGWIGFVRHGVTFHWHGGIPADFTLPLDAWMGGIGPKLLAAAPVRAEGLRFSDKEPCGNDDLGWAWWNHGSSHFQQHRVPFELEDLAHKRFPTESAAHDALARAAIRWAGRDGVQR